MEQNEYATAFGKAIVEERKKRKMNQLEFYRFLFPGTEKEQEAIIKKMNKVENGKQRSVDFDMLEAFCSKCDVSADHALGRDKSYRNHDENFVGKYTGLDENAIAILHKWSMDKENGADLSKINDAIWGEDADEQLRKMYVKQSAIQFLKIINYLFREKGITGKKGRKKKDNRYPNLSVIYSIYQLCMVEPKTISGDIASEDDTIYDPRNKWSLSQRAEIDASKGVILTDSDSVLYYIDTKEVLQKVAWDHLKKGLDSMIEQIKKEKAANNFNLY